MATVCRIAFGAVFLVSGTLKLRDPSWRGAAAQLRVPALLIPAVAPVEIVLGAGIAAGVAPDASMGLGLALLGAFTAVLVAALRIPAGERPRCACFGRWSARPVDGWSVARNLVFAAIGVGALVG